MAQLTRKPLRLLATLLPAKPTANNRWQANVFNQHPNFRHVVVKTADNPYLPPTYVPMLKAAMPQAHWPMLLDGQTWPDNLPKAVKFDPQAKPQHSLPMQPTSTKLAIKGVYRQKYW